MYELCLSHQAKNQIMSKNQAEQNNIIDTMEKLRKGLWNGGTRVKKLHSVNRKKCIYEARNDGARRMLFSVHPKKQRENKDKALIYVHCISLAHDDVIRSAGNILNEDYNDERYYVEKECNESLDDIIDNEKFYPEQYQVYSYLDKAKFNILKEEDLIRFFNRSHDSKDEILEFQIKLSEEQEEILKKALPLLIAGTAGSGKTTLLLNKLLINPLEPKLYITSSNQLCNEVKVQFQRLVKGLDEEEEYLKNTDFLTFNEFLENYKPDKLQTIINKERFIAKYKKYARSNGMIEKFPPLMIWEEIRGVWKSYIEQSGNKMTLKEYEDITEKADPNFKKDSRKEAYKIYEWYENLLEEEYLLDELDLIKSYIISEKNINKKYSIVACDEVQDITVVHLLLLFLFAGYNSGKLIIAGDDNQIVNHSGFRWQNVKDTFYRHLNCSKPKLYELNRNYRSDGFIVDLAKSINKFQDEFLEKKYAVVLEDSLYFGEKPKLIIKLNEEEMLNNIHNLSSTQAILVKYSDEEEKLRNYFKDKFGKVPLIFTIEESKGLEFNSVILWKLAFDENEEWEKLLRKKEKVKELNNKEKKFIRYESSMLYVAATRGMKNCIIYDGEEGLAIWNTNDIKSKVEVIEKIDSIYHIFNEPQNDLQWFEQGKVLLRKKKYSQAIECFARIADKNILDEASTLKKECIALCEIENGNSEVAATLYIELNRIEAAAECYDNAGLYMKAAALYGTQLYGKKDVKKKYFYEAKYYDSIKNWHKSACICAADKKYYEAAVRFEKSQETNDLRSAAYIYEMMLENYDKAIQCYEAVGELKKSERCKNKKYLKENRVTFADTALENDVRDALCKIDKLKYSNCNDNIYTWDVELILSLPLYSDNIKSLEGVQKLKNLEDFAVVSNTIKDFGPLASLTNLTNVFIDDNVIEDMSIIYKLKNLKELLIQQSEVKKINGIEKLQNLETLCLASNQIEDISPISKLTKLKCLLIDGNKIKNLNGIEKLQNLATLSIGSNEIKDISPIGKLTKLKSLSINNNKIKDISALKNLTGLGTLSINNNMISNITPLANLNNLRGLYLDGNRIEDYTSLKNLKLTRIDVDLGYS